MYNKECCGGMSLLEKEVENPDTKYVKKDEVKDVVRYLKPNIKPENYQVPQGE